MKTKSIIDLINQNKRLSDMMEKRYYYMPKDSLERKNGLVRWNKRSEIYRKYAANIANILGGEKVVSGNMKLLTTKIAREYYIIG